MRSETKQALAEAIAAHLADEIPDGSITSTWVVVAETVDLEAPADSSEWQVAYHGSLIQARGLLEFGLDYTRWTPIDGGDA